MEAVNPIAWILMSQSGTFISFSFHTMSKQILMFIVFNNGDVAMDPIRGQPIVVNLESPESPDFITRKSMEFYPLVKELGVSRNGIDSIIKWVNTYVKEPGFGK